MSRYELQKLYRKICKKSPEVYGTDSVLLREGLGLNDDEIKMLRDIWDKLRNRRLNRNKK